MTKAIFRSILLVSLAVLLITLFTTFWVSFSVYNDKLRYELKQQATYTAAGVKLNGLEYLTELDKTDMRITWIAANGDVLYDNKADITTMENHTDREEIHHAMHSGEGYAVRKSNTLSTRTIYYALLLDDASVLRVSSTQYSLFAVFGNMMQPILIVCIATLLCAGLIAVSLSKKIVSHVSKIDSEAQNDGAIYPELRPIVDRLHLQNAKIMQQMSELTAKRNEFNTISGNMSEGILIINAEGEILSCNRSALLVFHADQKQPKHILSLDDSPTFRKAVFDALSGKNGYDSKNVGGRYFTIMTTPITGEDGDVDGALIFILDETEKEARDTLRREFTSNVSHELKTPLTSISGFAELIMSGMTDVKETKHFAENIYKEARRLIHLVEDIIRLSALDGEELTYEKEAIDLLPLGREVLERLAPIAEKNNISLSCVGESLIVQSNRTLLGEILYNLCDNAIKYNHPNGQVTVTLSVENTRPTVRISDTGIGIPLEEQNRVFERFYRVDKSHSKEIGGTGLGLSIVKHGAAQLGISISLQSEHKQGTTITLSFPFA